MRAKRDSSGFKVPRGVMVVDPSESEGVDASDEAKASMEQIFEGPPREDWSDRALAWAIADTLAGFYNAHPSHDGPEHTPEDWLEEGRVVAKILPRAAGVDRRNGSIWPHNGECGCCEPLYRLAWVGTVGGEGG